MGLVGNDDDVVAGAVGLVRVHVLVELVDQAEDEAVILLQQFLQLLAGAGARGFLVRDAAADKRAENLVVEVLAVGGDDEGEVAGDVAPDLLGEHDHGIGLAAALGVPEDAEAAEVRVGALDDGELGGWLRVESREFDGLLSWLSRGGRDGARLRRAPARQARAGTGTDGTNGTSGGGFQFDDAVFEAAVGRDFAL